MLPNASLQQTKSLGSLERKGRHGTCECGTYVVYLSTNCCLWPPLQPRISSFRILVERLYVPLLGGSCLLPLPLWCRFHSEHLTLDISWLAPFRNTLFYQLTMKKDSPCCWLGSLMYHGCSSSPWRESVGISVTWWSELESKPAQMRCILLWFCLRLSRVENRLEGAVSCDFFAYWCRRKQVLVSGLQLCRCGKAGLPGSWGAHVDVLHFHAIPCTTPRGCYGAEVKCSFGLELPTVDEFFPLFVSPCQNRF